MPETTIEYDKYGRMRYNPLFHTKTNKPWEDNDLDYLVNWYYIIGPEEMSYAIERTIKSTMGKVAQLKKDGVMKKPLKQVHFIKIKIDPLQKGPIKISQ